MGKAETYARRRDYYKQRAIERYYAKREEICAAWRERYASDPGFRAHMLAQCRRNRARRKGKPVSPARAPRGSLRVLLSLRTMGIVPDLSGILIVPTDAPADQVEMVELLCAHDDRYDWKFEGDA